MNQINSQPSEHASQVRGRAAKNFLEKSATRPNYLFSPIAHRDWQLLLMKDSAPAISPPNGIGDSKPRNQAVLDWVQDVAKLTQPENIFWCDGSERENTFLLEQAMRQNVVLKLNEKKVPRSYLHRSNPNDVARVEEFTFICTPKKEEAGPTNNSSEPWETYTNLHETLKRARRGRTKFVSSYMMRPPKSR